MKLIKKVLLPLLAVALLSPTAVLAQQGSAAIEGYVTGGENAQPLMDVNVALLSTDSTMVKATSTNKSGRYSLNEIDPGTYILRVTYIGYRKWQEKMEVSSGSRVINISLVRNRLALDEISVTAPFQRQDSSDVQLSITQLRASEVTVTAGANSDVFNLLKVTPGVTTTSDFSNQLIVRGGEANQNLIELDGIEIYSPYQSNGMGSIFNPSLISDLTFYSGAYPARYGDRLSSVLSVNTREGAHDEILRAGVDINMLYANLTLEGKTGFWDGTWIASARRTYYNSFANVFARRMGNFNDIAYPDFDDLNTKLVLRPGHAQKIEMIYLQSNDVIDWIVREDEFGELEFDDSDFRGKIKAYNTATGLNWSYTPNPVFQSKLYANWYRNRGNNELSSSLVPGLEKQSGPGSWLPPSFEFDDTLSIGYKQNLELQKYSMGGDLNVNYGRHSIEFGGSVDYLVNDVSAGSDLNPFGKTVFQFIESASPILETLGDSVRTDRKDSRLSLYAQDRITLLKNRLFIRPGLRYSHYNINNESAVNPRLGISYIPFNSYTFRIGVGKFVQSPGYEKLIRPDNAFNITRFPQVDHLSLEEGWHYVFEVNREFKNGWGMEVEAFYKYLKDLITSSHEMRSTPVASYFPGDHRQITNLDPDNYKVNVAQDLQITDRPINNERGISKGVEFLIRKDPSEHRNQFYGWASYSYSKSDRINWATGQKVVYPFDYDRRHAANLVLNKPFGDHWHVGMTWKFGTGFPFTPAVAIEPMMYTREGAGFLLTDPETGLIRMTPDFGDIQNKNSRRYPHYNRIDLRISYQNENDLFGYNIYLDLINITNRRNVQSYKYVLKIADPNPPDLPPSLRQPSRGVLFQEPIYMFPFLPTLGLSLSL